MIYNTGHAIEFISSLIIKGSFTGISWESLALELWSVAVTVSVTLKRQYTIDWNRFHIQIERLIVRCECHCFSDQKKFCFSSKIIWQDMKWRIWQGTFIYCMLGRLSFKSVQYVVISHIWTSDKHKHNDVFNFFIQYVSLKPWHRFIFSL